jgi:hypothetical protein
VFINFKILTRLIGSFSPLVSLILLIDTLSMSSITCVRDQMVRITERRMTEIFTLENFRRIANWASLVPISTPTVVY